MVGQTFNTSILVKNTGGSTLIVTGVTPSGANPGDFVLGNLSGCNGYPAFSLSSQQSCLLSLAYTPGAMGTRTATFTLVDNESTPEALTLTGYGKNANGPGLQLSFQPNPVNGQILYPDTVVNTSTFFTTATVSIQNLGTGSVQVTSATLTGDFAQTNTCQGVITSCMYTISFAPKQAGVRTGTLTLVTNAPGGQTFVVNFTGNGVLIPQVSLTPPNLNFSKVASSTTSTAQTVTLKNTGNGTLNLANVSVAAPFSQTNTCGTSLVAGATCTFTVKFAPATSATAAGVLSFTGNAPGGTFQVGLRGQGVTGPVAQLTPASLSFGNQSIGTTSAGQTVTLANAGDTSFAVSGLQASENFTASNNCPVTLAAGSSCTITVKFAPTTDTFLGFSKQGAIYVTTTAPGSPISIPVVGTATASNGAATNLVVASSLNPATVGQSVTFTAMVTSLTSGTPTGTVAFLDGGNSLGAPVTLSATKATFTTSSLAQGNHSINFTYSGDSTFAPATSSGLVQFVTAATSTAVQSSLNPSALGQSITFTATVTLGTAGTITGSVIFLDGTSQLGVVTLNAGVATLQTSMLALGSHSITAKYPGGGSFSASTSSVLTQVVNATGLTGTTTALTSSANPSVPGQSVTYTATVHPASGAVVPTGTVKFFDGTTQMGTGTLNAGVATFQTSTLTVASHSITAQYSGDANFLSSTSPAITQIVNAASKAATATALASSQNPSAPGGSVTFSATVTSSTAGIITGTVTFLDGATTLGSGAVSAGKASFTTAALASASHSITASYGGDAIFAASTSSVFTQVMLKPSVTALVSSPNPSVNGQSVTFTATVTSSAGGTPTGTVTFLDGATQIGSPSTLTAGSAAISISSLSQAIHAISAQYSGDANFAASTSLVASQTVGSAAIVVSSTAPAVTAGQSTPITLTAFAANGSNLTFTLSCVGNPLKSSCAFAPNPVTPVLAGTPVQLTFSTASSRLPSFPSNRTPWPWGTFAYSAAFAALLAAGMIRAMHATRRRFAFGMCFAVVALAVAMVGCGTYNSGGSTYTGTPKGTATFMVVGTSSGTPAVTISTPVSVTVQ